MRSLLVETETPCLESRGFVSTSHRFYAIMTKAQFLMVARTTSGQTRSGSGHTKALGEDFPRSRTCLYILYRCPQARLRTFPGRLGNRGDQSSKVE